MLQRIRAFFDLHGVMEVETPVLSRAATSEVHLDSWCVTSNDQPEQTYFLQTSPELFMKRLLADSAEDIYQICKVFRAGEQGTRHNPEFTLLEWYRVGFDLAALMQEVESLLNELLSNCIRAPAMHTTYEAVFQDILHIDPFSASMEQLTQCYQDKTGSQPPSMSNRQDALDLLMSEVIEPALPANRLVFVNGYPAQQASLARIDDNDPRTARRFEVFCGGLELANGFEELTDANEQQQRMHHENQQRQAAGLDEVPLDEHFLSALRAGLPACSGVAVGLDRILMLMTNETQIDRVISFSADRT